MVRHMNHDYAHCSDYEANKARCPKSCFRAELTRDLSVNPQPRTSWMHFAGTDECPLKSFTVYWKDGENHEN